MLKLPYRQKFLYYYREAYRSSLVKMAMVRAPMQLSGALSLS
jgi:hypothetical protein